MTSTSGRWMVAAIAEVARSRPESPAIIDHAGTMSYGELWQASTALARELRVAGIGADALTAIAATRGSPFVVGALGSWLADCAYVPLDMLNPPARLAAIAADARPAVLLASDDLAGTGGSLDLPEVGIPGRLAGASANGAGPGADSAGDRVSGVADPPAYVMYTSGTTGRPKGVVIGHASLANLAQWFAGRYRVGARDRILHTAGLGFDASVLEIFPFLAAGGTVVACPDEDRMLTEAVADRCERSGCTFAFLPTALCQQALATGFRPASLRYLITGGDQLRLPCPVRGAYTVINVYGPTESTVATTAHDVRGGEAGQTPPIGLAVRGAELALLNQERAEVPAGEIGELYISGATLAHGYVRQPELTAERFALLPGRAGRWYRTGDLVRWAGAGGPSDVLLFCGRADREQLKVRGVRAEASEIEAALLDVPGVIAAAVTVPKAADVALAALLVAPDRPSPRSLRGELVARLPAYLIPDRFIIVDRLPLTVNGKIDRQAVADLAEARLQHAGE